MRAVMRVSGITVATALVGSLLAAPAGAKPADPPGLEFPGDPAAMGENAVIVYWGIDADGNYFETMPLDADNPANLGVTNAQDTRPLNEAAQPVVVLPGSTRQLTGDRARTALVQAAANGQLTGAPSTQSVDAQGAVVAAADPPLYCARWVGTISKIGAYLTFNVGQSCTGGYLNHWVDWQIKRKSGFWWAIYWPWTASSSKTVSTYTWGFQVTCGGGASNQYIGA